MPQITLDITNAVATRIQAAICIPANGYTGFEEDGVTPQTKLIFFKKWIIKQVREEVKHHEKFNIIKSTTITNDADVDSNVKIS